MQLGNGAANGALATTGLIVDNATLAFANTGTTTQGTQFSSGAIGGTGGLLLAGNGTLVLNAANTFSGATTISAGTLQLANLNALQNSTLADNVSGGLTFANSGAYIVNGLSGSGGIALSYAGSGALTLSFGANNAANTFSGVLSGSGAPGQGGQRHGSFRRRQHLQRRHDGHRRDRAVGQRRGNLGGRLRRLALSGGVVDLNGYSAGHRRPQRRAARSTTWPAADRRP